jgi:integrase
VQVFSVEQTKLFLKFVNSLVYKHFKPKVVSEQLGHTSAAFTLDVYSHVLPHMQDDAAAKVEAALMGSTSGD